MNGAIEPVSSRLPGSTVTVQCEVGYVSAVTVVTCEGTLMWSPDLEGIKCTSQTQPPPTTRELSSWLYGLNTILLHLSAPPMNCTTPLSLPQNGNISDHSLPAIPGTQVTFQCDKGLFPEGIMTATCLATGEWDKNPGEIVCRNESSE